LEIGYKKLSLLAFKKINKPFMKLNHLFFFLSFLQLFNACKDDCLKSREEITELRQNYITNPSADNCFAYSAALQSYLRKNCSSSEPEQVFYDKIFQSYLDELPCYDPSTGGTIDPPTCNDGIQNRDEEGVDCGGSFCPACPPPPPANVYINFTLNGNAYNFNSPTNTNNSGTSGLPFYVFSSGGLNSAQVEGTIKIHFYQNNSVTLADFQSMIGVPYPFNTPGSDNFAEVEVTIPNGTTYVSANAGNNASNSSLVVLGVTVQSSATTGGNLVETYRVRGIFNCEVTDGGGSSSSLTNGNFELIFLNY
jgi:hypothetical protein